MSGADPASRRGTEYGDAYTLGVTVPLTENSSTVSAIRNAVETEREDRPDLQKTYAEDLKDAGNYLDYYECLDVNESRAFIVGASYNVKELKSRIRAGSLKNTLLGALYQLLLLELVMRHVLLYVIHPLKKILRSIRQYTETRDSRAVHQEMTEVLTGRHSLAIRENEIGQLARDFTGLTEKMDNYVEQITTVTSQKERYETELNIAAEIQEQILPKELLEQMKEEIDAFAGEIPQFDDTTMLSFYYRRGQSENRPMIGENRPLIGL